MMKTLYRLFEFLFDRWKKEVILQGTETWQHTLPITGHVISENERNFVDYKYTHKFDGSTKIKREYLN